LTLNSVNPSSIIAAASVVSFTVTGIRNPISTELKSGMTITTLASNGGSIDSSALTLQVSTAATIAAASTSSLNTTIVNEKNNLRLLFTLPVEMEANWSVEITFPSDIVIVTFADIFGYNVFGGKTSLLSKSTVHSANNTVVITNALSTYTTTELDALLEFETITNPLSTKTTDSFQIYLKTSGGSSIASLSSGVTFTSTVGAITAMTATPGATTVGISTTVLFSFVPTHLIPVSSQIIVTLPIETSIVAKDSGSCTLSSLSEIQSAATCTISGRIITISNPFSADFTQDGTKTLTFQITEVSMPGTTTPSSEGTFRTCFLVSGT
jgi:hypothetical protein